MAVARTISDATETPSDAPLPTVLTPAACTPMLSEVRSPVGTVSRACGSN
jgi:hypothetical protein